MTQILHYLTYIIPLLSVGVHLLLRPEVKPLWMSLPGRWPQIVGAACSFIGTTLASKGSGDDWGNALMKGIVALTATGLLGHGLTPAVLPTTTVETKTSV